MLIGQKRARAGALRPPRRYAMFESSQRHRQRGDRTDQSHGKPGLRADLLAHLESARGTDGRKRHRNRHRVEQWMKFRPCVKPVSDSIGDRGNGEAQER